jgi:hypothetical protein
MPALAGALIAVLGGMALTSCGDDTAKPAPAAVTGPAVALQDDHLTLTNEDPEPRMELLAATGAKVTRFDILWRFVAKAPPADPTDPADPAYDFAHYDAVVKGLSERGITPIVSVYSAPDFETGGREDGDAVVGWNSLVPRADAYGAFMEAVSRRYSGTFVDRDGKKLPRVRHWEVWNEPNLRAFLSPQIDSGGKIVSAEAYAGLVRAAYTAIKRGGGRDTVVLVGASGPKSRTQAPQGVGAAQWLSELRRLDVPLDAYSMHIYPAAAPTVETDVKPSWSTVDDFLAELDEWRPGLDLYITEAGYTTEFTAARPKGFVTEEQQAQYLREIFDHPLVQNPRVRAIVWFNMQDNDGWTAGLIRSDVAGAGKKPSYEVFQEVAKQREQRTLDN